MGFLTRLIAGFVAASTLGAGLAGTANAVDAAGAASDTTGAVTTTADDTGGRTVLDCRQSGEGATGPYADKFCWIDWSNLPLDSSGKPTPVRINVPGGHIDADATITHTDNAALTAKDYTGSKWSRLTSAYKLTGNTALAFSGRMGRQDPAASVTFSNVTPSADRTDTGVNVLKDFQLAFGDAEVMSGGVLQGHDVYERTDIESDKTLEKLGLVGSGDPNQSYSKANTGYGTTHVTLAGGPKGATDDANKDSKGAAVVGAKQASRFKVSFGQVNQHWDGWGSAIAVGVYMPYLTAYPLTYDKNASDAAGEVPSNQRGKENTVQPAKSKTTGTANAVDVTGATGTTKSVVKLSDDGGNETSEDTADNPDDDSTDADSTTDAGAQSDAGQQAEIQSSTSQDKATAKSSLPDHIVNGSFDYPACPDGKNSCDVDPTTGWGGFYVDYGRKFMPIPDWDRSKFGWDSSQEGLRPDQQPNSHQKLQHCVQIGNKPNNNGQKMNRFAEIIAETPDEYIYQDIATTPGVMYRWSLKHASENASHVDSMQVMIGSPGRETAQDATRTTSNGRGDRTGVTSKTIATKGGQAEWETYTGVYIATSTVTRFTFKSAQGRDSTRGNFIDDVMFTKAYKLTYDRNSADASGQVPSNQRGKENTTQPAKTKTNGTVKTVAEENAQYGSLANGDFSYPSFSDIQKNEQENAADLRTFIKSDDGTLWYNMSSTDLSKYRKIGQIPGFDSSRFAWSSTENGSRVELQQDRNTKNTYAEIVAQQDNTSIYQNVSTGNGGVLYKIRLKHASRQSSHADRMQVLVGSDTDHATPVEMTRVTSNGHGDKVGGKSTIITTKVSNTDPRDHGAQWETYEGYYQVPEGQKNTVFMFKSLEGFKEYETLSGNNIGNLVDDIEFSRSYKLTYDKNSDDATGSVPSDTAANTVKQAKSKANGSVKLVADRTASGLTVHDLKKGDIAPAQYGDFKFSTTDGVTAGQITDVNGFTVKTNWNPMVENQAYAGRILGTMYQPNKNGASLVLHHVGQWRDSSGTQRWLNAKITVNGQNLGSLVYYESQHKFLASYGKWDRHTSSRPYMDVTVDFLLDDGSTPQGLRGVTGFTDLDGGTSGYNEGVELVSGFDGAYVRSDAHLARFGTNGWAGATDENENNADAHGMKHYVGATFTGSSFHVRWSVASGQARGSGFQPVDSTIAYRLTYDKNAQDATGSIPSDTAANTTQPAKSETDGKVSDLVQRTTTHEDGSVTVRTVDTTTDVVSGCQVYYPAGQRITLATMAKDDDCWDSSMLSRPGHTQLGWNQDRNATQAQAEVTMVEGGMTVFAVWVGNPVLTYDTNKPSTWDGQMPSTPASVSVAYNTAAADGSGWRAGDVSKIRGYRFLGWYTAPQDNAGLYDWTRPLTGSVTVYAHWQRLQANVVYDANGGTGSHPNTTGWQYSDVTVPSDTSKSFKRDGYYFKYWNTQKDGKGTTYKDGGQVPLQDKDVTLYAIWAPYHTVITETGGVGLPVLVAAGMGLLVVGIGSTVMLTRRMRGEQ